MGINLIVKTDLKSSLKLLNHINTFLFEEEFGDLKNFSPSQIESIRKAARTLSKVIKNG